jgi:predicted Zn finger-like uncharacterized protein
MRTRCPVCNTVFRVTSEQLRLKAGKVRCGHCQAVFNAFDELMEETEAAADSAPPLAPSPKPAPIVQPPPPIMPAATIAPIALPLVAPHPPVQAEAPLEPSIAEPAKALEWDTVYEPLPTTDAAPDAPPADLVQALPESIEETTEQSTQAAREAGLMAVRELNDAATYNRWSEGTLASSGLGDFAGDTPHRATWPFVLVAVLLACVLLGQMAYHFRTELVQRLPAMAGLYEALALDVPLPRHADLVAIEASNLQSDNGRGLFILQATLHNRARFAQEWPALELTLTDTTDTVVSRRVLLPADYLPPGSTDAFSANGDLAVKLWVEARNIGAAGYRLYIFYP